MNYYKNNKKSDPKMDAYYEGMKLLNAQKKEFGLTDEQKKAEIVRNIIKQDSQ